MVQNIDIHQQLIEQCKRGESKAQYQLYNLYAKQMLNISYRIVSNRMEAEDVLQESFINAFSKLNTFKGDASFGSWLKRIVINRSLNVLRKKKEFYDDLNEERVADLSEENTDYNEGYTVSDVRKAMMSLPDGYRVVFSLYMFEELSHKEIAEELNISENTSKSQLSRAKNKLKSLMIN